MVHGVELHESSSANRKLQKRDIATATATFGFVRNLGSAISIVVGSVVFQNEMISKEGMLQAALGAQTAAAFGGGSAGANVGIISTLPDNQKLVARQAFSDSLDTMWIMYVCFSAAGLLVSLLITKNVLQKSHEETKTGLEAEEERKLERQQERQERKRKRASKGELPLDAEAGVQGAEAKETKA